MENELDCLLEGEVIDLEKLRKMVRGMVINPKKRYKVWKVFLGITPPLKNQRELRHYELEKEYKNYLSKYMQNMINPKKEEEEEEKLRHQITIDCKRTTIMEYAKVMNKKEIQNILFRVLYLTTKSNESMGYFQGLNDILSKLVFCYLYEYIEDIQSFNDSPSIQLCEMDLFTLEMNSFFSLKKMLEWIFRIYSIDKGSVYARDMLQDIQTITKTNSRKKKILFHPFFFINYYFLI